MGGAGEVEKQQTFCEYQVDIFRAEGERAQTGVKMHEERERVRERVGDVFISEWCHSIPSGFLAFPFKAQKIIPTDRNFFHRPESAWKYCMFWLPCL